MSRAGLITTTAWQKSWHPTHLICYIINHDGCLGTSVVHGSQTVVALLTSCVPDFKLDCCVVQTYCLSQEGSCRDTKAKGGSDKRACGNWAAQNVFLWGNNLRPTLETHRGLSAWLSPSSNINVHKCGWVPGLSWLKIHLFLSGSGDWTGDLQVTNLQIISVLWLYLRHF